VSIVKRVRANPAFRRAAVPLYREFARGVVMLPPPRVFANSMPKAGTHLLMATLSAFPRMMFSGVHHALTDFSEGFDGLPPEDHEVDWARVGATLDRLRNGQYMTGHFPHSRRLEDLLQSAGYRSIVILRDPRDTVVSQSFYLTSRRRHPQYRRYSERLTSMDERLITSIQGVPADSVGPAVPSVGRRVARYAAWLDAPETLVVRYETLVGSAGGGSDDAQCSELERIAAHIHRPLSSAELRRLAARIRSPRSATFRKGEIGDWRNHFGEHHREAFKRQAGELLVRLGYEVDLNW
jgi:hypothetical protein